MAKKITREEEASLPAFKSHIEAKAWFVQKYGADFVWQTAEPVGDELCYFYNLVHDWEAYASGRKKMMKGEYATGVDFILSYQPIQIMENGSVHIVH